MCACVCGDVCVCRVCVKCDVCVIRLIVTVKALRRHTTTETSDHKLSTQLAAACFTQLAKECVRRDETREMPAARRLRPLEVEPSFMSRN